MFVQAVTQLAIGKAASLRRLGLKGLQLPIAAASAILSAVPPTTVDLTSGIRLLDQAAVLVRPESAVGGALFRDCSHLSMSLFPLLPRNIVTLDFSVSVATPGFWEPLAQALQSCAYPIALRALSLARRLAAGNQSFLATLHFALLNPNINLQSLDITGSVIIACSSCEVKKYLFFFCLLFFSVLFA